jgi:hypothetical protein
VLIARDLGTPETAVGIGDTKLACKPHCQAASQDRHFTHGARRRSGGCSGDGSQEHLARSPAVVQHSSVKGVTDKGLLRNPKGTDDGGSRGESPR